MLSGVKELREAIAEAQQRRRRGVRTVLFIDEIHRYNKAQQDALLQAVEDGTVTLIGATTENPSFEVIAALLSRTKVLTLQPLSEPELLTILQRALTDAERGLGALRAEAHPETLESTRGRLGRRRTRGPDRARVGGPGDRARPRRHTDGSTATSWSRLWDMPGSPTTSGARITTTSSRP